MRKIQGFFMEKQLGAVQKHDRQRIQMVWKEILHPASLMGLEESEMPKLDQFTLRFPDLTGKILGQLVDENLENVTFVITAFLKGVT